MTCLPLRKRMLLVMSTFPIIVTFLNYLCPEFMDILRVVNWVVDGFSCLKIELKYFSIVIYLHLCLSTNRTHTKPYISLLWRHTCMTVKTGAIDYLEESRYSLIRNCTKARKTDVCWLGLVFDWFSLLTQGSAGVLAIEARPLIKPNTTNVIFHVQFSNISWVNKMIYPGI